MLLLRCRLQREPRRISEVELRNNISCQCVMNLSYCLPFICALLLQLAGTAHASDESSQYNGIIIDPHAQIDHEITEGEFIQVTEASGISKVILSSIYQRSQKSIIKLARKHPGLIIPAIRTKTRTYVFSPSRHDQFKRELESQAANTNFGAMQELLGYHAIKAKHAPNEPKEILAPPLDKKITIALDIAKQKGWPH